MTRGAFPIYPMCYLQDSDTRGGCAAYATTRQGKEVRDCVCFRVGGCFGCSWVQVSFNFATIRPQHLSQPAAHHSPCSIPSPSPLPSSAPPTHVSSLQPHHPFRQPLFGVFSRVPVLDQGSNITPNQSKNITHVSKLCRFFFFLQQPFASPFSPNFPLLASSPSIQ